LLTLSIALFRRLVAGLSPRGPASDPSPVQLACMADKADNVAGFCRGFAVFAVCDSACALYSFFHIIDTVLVMSSVVK
jgi:hypothetical protein